MEIKTSKTQWNDFMALVGRAVAIIKSKEPTNKEYNVARRLWIVKNKIEKKNR